MPSCGECRFSPLATMEAPTPEGGEHAMFYGAGAAAAVGNFLHHLSPDMRARAGGLLIGRPVSCCGAVWELTN